MMNSPKPLYKTLIIGTEGFLGANFFRLYSSFFNHIPPIQRRGIENSIQLEDPRIENWNIAWNDYDYAIVCAAVTNVARCQANKAYCYKCNLEGTISLCYQLLDKRIIPILFSSDYVFDGKSGNYSEESEKNPLNVYGETKDRLEEKLKRLFPDNFIVLRLSKVYSLRRIENDFVIQISEAMKRGDEYKAAGDQIFSPVHVMDVINSTILLQNDSQRGLFNIAGRECVSRYQIASRLSKIGRKPDLIRKISLEDLSEPFDRPKNTTLDCCKFLKLFPYKFSSILDDLSKMRETSVC